MGGGGGLINTGLKMASKTTPQSTNFFGLQNKNKAAKKKVFKRIF